MPAAGPTSTSPVSGSRRHDQLFPTRGAGAIVLSLAHYFEQNGDLCQDPEMTVRVFLHGLVEAGSELISEPVAPQLDRPGPQAGVGLIDSEALWNQRTFPLSALHRSVGARE